MEIGKSWMPAQDNVRPIVQPGSPYRPIIEAKAGCPNNVERNVRRGAKSRDVSRIGWNLRLDKCDANHQWKTMQLIQEFFIRR